MNTSLGYEIKTAANGGFVVRDANNPMQPGTYRDDIAAFTNATDMIAWLAREHGVPFGGFDVPADNVETVKLAIEQARTPIYDELCEDEGCDHHGIPHVCVNWVTWSGGERPVDAGTLVDVKFRNGSVSKCKLAKVWSWEHRSLTEGGDIVAYRVI
jgi:hypothetical protein